MPTAAPLTRRHLLALGGLAFASASMPSVARAGSTPVTKNSWLERGTYNSRVGQTFLMDGVALKLAAVLDLVGTNSRDRPLAGRNDAFTLSFSGSQTGSGFQETRLFTHPELGQHPLFVVAGRGVDGPLTYTVTVNRSA